MRRKAKYLRSALYAIGAIVMLYFNFWIHEYMEVTYEDEPWWWFPTWVILVCIGIGFFAGFVINLIEDET